MAKEPITAYRPSLAEITQDTSAALLLQQLIFWFNDANSLPKLRRDDLIHPVWGLRKSAKEIQDFFKWKRAEYDRANFILEDKNLVTINAKGVPCTTHYLMHFDEIKIQLSVCRIPANWIAEILQTGLPKSSNPVSVYQANSNSNKDSSFEDSIEKAEEVEKPATATAIFNFFENNGFGKATGHNKSELQKLADNHSEEWIMYAMAQGVEHNKKNLAYIKSILKRIKQEGQIIGAKNVNGTNKSGITQPKGYGQFTRLENASPESNPTSQATINAAQRIVAAKRAKAEGKSNV